MTKSPENPSLLTRQGPLWVINKPAGWVVHPTNDPSMLDLISWAQEHFPDADGIAPINRIDRFTSGLVLLSPDPDYRGHLGTLFAEEKIQKEYRCLVYGKTPPSRQIDKPLADARRGKPLEALTRFETLQVFVSCSYLSVRPETGRKHQIRRHLQGINHAIVGESRYRPKKFLRVPGFPGRLWLHAHRLLLPDGQEFTAPLASELQEHLELLERLANED